MARFILLFISSLLIFESLNAQQVKSEDNLVIEEVRIYISDYANQQERVQFETILSDFFSSLNRDYNLQKGVPERQDQAGNLGKIWEASPFFIPEQELILEAVRNSEGQFEFRNIPALFTTESEEVYNELSITLELSGEILELDITLPQHQYVQLLSQSSDAIDEGRRKVILDFTEDFRTAYNTKDLEFIENVFSDQAIIIVGNVVKSQGESPFQNQVEYLRFTKTEYMDRLKRVFSNNEFIDVQFEKIDILQHPKYPHMYGVSMEQYYASSTYSDEGYLFLLVDFQNENEPLIHVRTWEPMQVVDEGNHFTLGDMNIIF